MSDDGKRYRVHRTPPRGYPVPQNPDAKRSDGAPITFVDETSGVHDAATAVPVEVVNAVADIVESSLRKYHTTVAPSHDALAALGQMQSRLNAIVEELALPMLKDVLARANTIKRLQESASAKLDVFIKHEFMPVKAAAEKIPGMQKSIDALGSDLEELRKEFAASEDVRRNHVREIKALRDRSDLQSRAAERSADMIAGEKRLAKKLMWLASGVAGAVGFVAQRWGADVLQFLKGLL